MAKKKKEESHNEMTGMMRWLLTYADLVTLLLIVFIVLFSVSNQDAEKFKNLAQYLRAAFGRVLQQGPTFLAGQGERIIPDLFQRISSAVGEAAGEGGGTAAVVKATERGIVVTLLTDRVLFDSGSVSLKPEMKQILDALGGPLRGTSRPVLVEGHTDDKPVRGGGRGYSDNMELSTLRACKVVQYLKESAGIPPKRMSAAGYAEYRPVVPNRDENSRRRNRRIDIVILKGDEGA